MLRDIRLAIRSLRATPVVTFVALLSLAFGIGANTAIFSLVDSLLLRALPVTEPERLVIVSSATAVNRGLGGWAWSYPVWNQIRERPALFDGALAWSPNKFNLAVGGEARLVDGVYVSGSFFSTLGVTALNGRVFSEADDVRGGGRDSAVAVISYRFWQRHYAGVPDAIGRTLTLDKVPFRVVGVTRPDFFGTAVGQTFDVIVPIGTEPLLRGRETVLDRFDSWLIVMARLKRGQTLNMATEGIRRVQRPIFEATVAPRTRPEYRQEYLGESFALVPAETGYSYLRYRYGQSLMALMVIVALVLTIACANIANLLLARTTARRHELSIRRALGASRWRLVRQLFTESAVLATAGAAFGLLLASWASPFLVRQLSTSTNTVFLDVSLDWRILAFTAGVASATAVLFGTAPALGASTAAPIEALRQQRASAMSTIRHRLGENALVVAQIALSLVLVVAAGLFVRTLTSLATRATGLERNRVLLVRIDSQPTGIEPGQRASTYGRIRDAVRVLPGVSEAAVSMATPVGNTSIVLRVDVRGGAPVPEKLEHPNGFTNVVSPGWFRTFGIPLVAGRDFSDEDRQGTPLVAIVNQTLARQFLGEASPLGRSITLTTPGRAMPMEIVGVVADSVYTSLRQAIPATVYTPIAQFYMSPVSLTALSLNVRAAGGSPAALAQSVAAAIATVNPELALTFRPLSDQVDASLTQERLIAMLAGFFAALALLLAGLGLFGLTSYAVARRRPEIAIRMALGAAPASIVRLVLSRVSALLAVGIMIGAALSVWASQFSASLLYGVEPRDANTLIAAAGALAAVAAVAASLPAWRVSRIDPAEALRES